MEKRTVTIESPRGNILLVHLEPELVDNFVMAATKKAGFYRSKTESFQHAIESAVTTVMASFIEK